MDHQEDKRTREISNLFAEQLNSHGFGFQYSLIEEIRKLSSQSKSLWWFVASEVPVSVKGDDTKIDFVLKRSRGPRFYMLAECKRANPALSNWCFAKSPYVHDSRASDFEQIILERLEPSIHKNEFKSAATKWTTAPNACHIALDVKSQAQGDKHDSGRGAIEKAASQIMRGLNGMVELLPQHPGIVKEKNYFLPVIFTTANLWMSDVDLSKADLATGKIDFSDSGFHPVDWVSYQYHLSPGIKHSYWMGNSPSEIPHLMDLDFIRTIPIVRAQGLQQFLAWSSFQLEIDI